MRFSKYQLFNSYQELGEDGIVIIFDKNNLPKQIPVRTKLGVRIVIGNFEDVNGDNFCMFLRVINSQNAEAAVIVADDTQRKVAEFSCAEYADKDVNLKLKLLKNNIPNFQVIFDGNRNDAFKS